MASNKKASVVNFSDTLAKILDQYGADVKNNLEEITKSVGQKTAKQLKSASGIFDGSGAYARGWACTMQKTRLGSTAVIHHKTLPGLPHLLEHGHVSIVHGRRVGSVKGREHIAPIEQQAIDMYEKEVISKL